MLQFNFLAPLFYFSIVLIIAASRMVHPQAHHPALVLDMQSDRDARCRMANNPENNGSAKLLILPKIIVILFTSTSLPVPFIELG
jgi:hypothetical protein